MGPCELMDLIGHDINYAVTESVYAANYYDKRYVPSLVQRELVDGGMLGRKSGRGFYALRRPLGRTTGSRSRAGGAAPPARACGRGARRLGGGPWSVGPRRRGGGVQIEGDATEQLGRRGA